MAHRDLSACSACSIRFCLASLAFASFVVHAGVVHLLSCSAGLNVRRRLSHSIACLIYLSSCGPSKVDKHQYKVSASGVACTKTTGFLVAQHTIFKRAAANDVTDRLPRPHRFWRKEERPFLALLNGLTVRDPRTSRK